jgi:hypothetical protein
MKFDGTNWVNVGNANFSEAPTTCISLAFSPSGQPYVAYDEDLYRATVMKFGGSNWVTVGTPLFSDSVANYTSLAFSPTNGEPFVAYQDWANLRKATVMQFNGDSWVVVGNAGFSAGDAESTNLTFSQSGQPYVSYSDGADSGRITVMKYDSVYFGINELQESMLSVYPNPAIDKMTIEITGNVNGSNLSIRNLNGQELITRQITQPKTTIDVSNLPSGVYFVRLTNDKTVEVGKFVKQ